jgi:hypothetical protein
VPSNSAREKVPFWMLSGGSPTNRVQAQHDPARPPLCRACPPARRQVALAPWVSAFPILRDLSSDIPKIDLPKSNLSGYRPPRHSGHLQFCRERLLAPVMCSGPGACASANNRVLLCAGICGKPALPALLGRSVHLAGPKWLLGRPLQRELRSGASVGPGAGPCARLPEFCPHWTAARRTNCPLHLDSVFLHSCCALLEAQHDLPNLRASGPKNSVSQRVTAPA